jgi:hypothetical protein
VHLVAVVFKRSPLVADPVQRYLRLEVRLVLRRRSYAALRPVCAFDSRSIATRGAIPGRLAARLRSKFGVSISYGGTRLRENVMPQLATTARIQ